MFLLQVQLLPSVFMELVASKVSCTWAPAPFMVSLLLSFSAPGEKQGAALPGDRQHLLCTLSSPWQSSCPLAFHFIIVNFALWKISHIQNVESPHTTTQFQQLLILVLWQSFSSSSMIVFLQYYKANPRHHFISSVNTSVLTDDFSKFPYYLYHTTNEINNNPSIIQYCLQTWTRPCSLEVSTDFKHTEKKWLQNAWAPLSLWMQHWGLAQGAHSSTITALWWPGQFRSQGIASPPFWSQGL